MLLKEGQDGSGGWLRRGESESRTVRLCHTWNQLVLPNPSKDQEEVKRREAETAAIRGEAEKKRRRTRAVSLRAFSFLTHFLPWIFHLDRVEKWNSLLLVLFLSMARTNGGLLSK